MWITNLQTILSFTHGFKVLLSLLYYFRPQSNKVRKIYSWPQVLEILKKSKELAMGLIILFWKSGTGKDEGSTCSSSKCCEKHGKCLSPAHQLLSRESVQMNLRNYSWNGRTKAHSLLALLNCGKECQHMSFPHLLRKLGLPCTFLLSEHQFKEDSSKEHNHLIFLSKLH